MPAESKFFPEHHLLYEHIYGLTPTEEIGASQAEHVRFLEGSETPVHIVIDLFELESTTVSLSEMKNVLKPMDATKILWIVFVVAPDNLILPFIVSVTTQIAVRGGRIKLVNSLEEAFNFLQERDPALDLHELVLEIKKQYRSALDMGR